MTLVATFQRRTTALLAAILAAAALALVPVAAQSRIHVIVQSSQIQTAETAVRNAGGTVTRPLPIAGGFAATIPADSMSYLQHLAFIRAVSLDARVHVFGQPDPSKVKSVYPKAVNADKVWASGQTGAGVTVALVDTGIANVPDLAGRVVPVKTYLLGQQTAPCVNFSGEDNCDDS